MTRKEDGAVLRVEDACCGSDVAVDVGEGKLHAGDRKTGSLEGRDDLRPGGAVGPGSMDENDVLYCGHSVSVGGEIGEITEGLMRWSSSYNENSSSRGSRSRIPSSHIRGVTIAVDGCD